MQIGNMNTQVLSLAAMRSASIVGKVKDISVRHLSSGKKINSAADDAAGLAISEKMEAQIRGLNKASQNIQDSISLFQTADGALNEISAMVNRCRELTIQSLNDTLTDQDRAKLDLEVQNILDEIDLISKTTEFNRFRVIGAEDPRPPVFKSSKTFQEIQSQMAVIAANNVSGAYADRQTFHIGEGADRRTFSFDVGAIMFSIDSNFHSYITNMYQPWGIDTVERDKFINVLEQALNQGFQSIDPLAPTLSLYMDTDDKLVIVLSSDEVLTMGSCDVASSRSVGHGFLHTMFQGSSRVNIETEKKLYVQMGANSNQGFLFTWSVVNTTVLGIDSMDVLAGRDMALDLCDTATSRLSTIRAQVGAFMNRLESAMRNVDVASENLSAALSRIEDADMASEMMDHVRANIIEQSSLFMFSRLQSDTDKISNLLSVI